MDSLPKVNKGIKRDISCSGKVQKIVLGVAVALGVAVTTMPAEASMASTVQPSIAPTSQAIQQELVNPTSSGALLLTPSTQATQLAYHYSHSSHSSHHSHGSHHSHYSSRW